MEELGFVKVTKEKKVRGSIKAKYFALDREARKKMRPINREILNKMDPEEFKEEFQQLLEFIRSSFFL